jgi:D-lactate dehydrogenase
MIEVAVYDTKPYDREYLGKNGDGIRWRFNEFRLNAQTASTARGSTAVCVFVNDRVDAPCIAGLKDSGVKLIALRCAGFNNVDLRAAAEAEITVVRVPAYSPYAVAEHTVGLLLTLNRKIHRAYNRVREHNFALNGLVGFDLHGKTVGIVGTGKIGRIAAEIFDGFGTKVLAYDPYPSLEWAKEKQIEYVPFSDLLVRSDIVTLHLPLTPESMHLLNEERMAQMKKGAIVINTSRGKLVDTAALINALKSGRLGGVALDVYEEEEGVFFEDLSGQVLLDDELSMLLTFPNVLVTSHQAFLTHEALSEIARVTSENIQRFERGTAPLDGTIVPPH